MTGSVSIIGGADGPTSIFLADKTSGGLFNLFGLVCIILILIPNIIYALKYRDIQNKCTNKLMNILEQVGRYGCMLLMIFGIDIVYGFWSVPSIMAYYFGNMALVVLYLIAWILFFCRPRYWKQLVLAIIPSCIFILSAAAMRRPVFGLFALVFAVAHIYVIIQNRAD